MKQEKRGKKTLQFWLAKEFIEERLCLSVPMTAIANFAAFIDIFEQQTQKTNNAYCGGKHDNHNNHKNPCR